MATLEQLQKALINADKAGDTEAAKTLAKAIKANTEISAPKRALFGALEPIDALAQMGYNALPESVQKTGDQFNNWLADKGLPLAKIPEGGFNQQLADNYQQYLAGKPSTDLARTAGNIATGIAATRKIPMGNSLKDMAKGGAMAGTVLGPLAPVYNPKADFWKEKAKQAGIGAVSGVAAAPVGLGLSRVINPKAASNPDVAKLKAAGVTPTVGQTLGGAAGRIEEKLQSMPIMGDAIMAARNANKEAFNTATINKAIAGIGGKVRGAGYDAIGSAQRQVSKAYDDALDALQGLKLDGRAQAEISSLTRLSSGLSKDVQRLYKKFLNDRIQPMISPAKGMQANTYKAVDSELRERAARFGKGSAMEQELGGLYKELRAILERQAQRSNPSAAKALKDADRAYANMVRIEAAAKSSVANDGIFTPGQLLGGIRQADQSARKRAFSGGKSLMQDFGRSAQNVLGNRYPDSGTAGRMLLDGMALGSGVISPAYPLSLLAGAGLYSRPAQKVLQSAITKRPQSAGFVSDLVRQSTPGTMLPLAGLLQSPN